MGKRLFDVLIAAFSLLLFAPVFALIAIALRCERRGPIFHLTCRMGRGGRGFRLLRFRTMVAADPETPVAERVTRVGRLIRNLSLDELPMLINVLKGDLSIVGPRPFPVDEVDPADPVWSRILSVRPGLVSYAILTLRRAYNSASVAERQRLELEYVQRQSLWFDAQTLGRALHALLRSRGNVKARG